MKEMPYNSGLRDPVSSNLLEDFRTHASRTMMLSELELLLEAVPIEESADEYRRAVSEENVLMKGAATTRTKSLRHLRELYVLDGGDPRFRALRALWDHDPPSRPLLALLAAVTRDGLLRATSETIIETPTGTPLDAGALSRAVAASFPDLLAPGILAKVGRNTASSWTQSGHLKGRSAKVRVRARPSVGAAVYALFMGHLSGIRGLSLYESLWARLLDAPEHELDSLAFAASQRGWMEYRRMGEVAEFGFSLLEGNLG